MRRCSWCGERGHNKATCPSYKAKIERLREQLGDDYWRVAEYDAARAKSRERKTRACSYCREPGHTRRKCSALQADIEAARSLQVEFRRKWMERAVEEGVGPGAMIRMLQWGKPALYFVTGSMTAEVNWWARPNQPVKGKRPSELEYRYEGAMLWPSAFQRQARGYFDRLRERNRPVDSAIADLRYGVILGIAPDAVRKQYSATWLAARDGSVEAAFRWSSRKDERGVFGQKREFDYQMRKDRETLVTPR